MCLRTPGVREAAIRQKKDADDAAARLEQVGEVSLGEQYGVASRHGAVRLSLSLRQIGTSQPARPASQSAPPPPGCCLHLPHCGVLALASTAAHTLSGSVVSDRSGGCCCVRARVQLNEFLENKSAALDEQSSAPVSQAEDPRSLSPAPRSPSPAPAETPTL